MLGGELDGIKNAQDLIEIASAAHGIDQHQLDFFVGADYEHSAHGGVIGGSAALARGSGGFGQHVVELGDLQFRIADHGIRHLVALRFFNVGGPFAVTGDGIDAQADNFCVALGELRLQPGHVAEFGGAHGSEILRMRKQDSPAVADPFVKVDGALGGFRSEVRSFGIDAQRHVRSSCFSFRFRDGWRRSLKPYNISRQ